MREFTKYHDTSKSVKEKTCQRQKYLGKCTASTRLFFCYDSSSVGIIVSHFILQYLYKIYIFNEKGIRRLR